MSADTPMLFRDVLARARANAATAAARGWVKPAPQPIPRDCPKCHGTGYQLGRAGEYAEARMCSCREPCPRCGNDRFVLGREGGYDVATPCECVSLVSRITAFNDAQIPAGYADKRLTPSHPGDVHGFMDRGLPSLKRAKAAVNAYRVSMNAEDMKGLVLIGGLGLGKTHLVCALLSYLALERGIACRFIDYSDLMARIRATFDDAGEERAASIIESLVTTEVLAIDDLGKGQGTNWELSILDQIVTRRYNARRIILATTNYVPESRTPADAVAQNHAARRKRDLADPLEDRIGDRLASRLRAACDFITLEGSDYRIDGPR